MASPVEAKLILCDAAQADPLGKLHMLGAGWAVTGSPTAPQAVAVMLKVPWDRTNQKIHVVLRLLDGDGKDVHIAAPDGTEQTLRIESEIEVGRPPGVAHGSHIPAAFAVNIPSLPLPPGRYVWDLVAAETTESESFQVMEQQTQLR